MKKGRILCCLFNHDRNENAIFWADRLSPHFDCVILDSGSTPPCPHKDTVLFPNIFYAGLMNEAARLCKEGGYEWLMIATSDLEIDDSNMQRLIDSMKKLQDSKNVALYQPSCRWSFRGRSLPHSLCHFTGGIRNVNYQEGWFHFMRADLLSENIFPIDTDINSIGWGIDLALCHIARLRKQLVLVDDSILVLHPKGRGYDRNEAMKQMKKWLDTIEGYESPRHFKALKAEINY